MASSMLRVRARSGIVTRYDLVQHGMRRMVGQALQPHAEAPNGFAWVPTGKDEEIPNLPEFRQAVKDGALWAADEDTARAVWGADYRKHFDDSFGSKPAPPANEAAAAPPAEAAATRLPEHKEIT
jgi:hypothetical protein